MENKRKIFQKAFAGILFFLCSNIHFLDAQVSFFKFPITQPGIYKVNQNQLNQISLGDISTISIYGNPGMLPQVLDSATLGLQEIPTQLINGELFFYLEGPHQIRVNDDSWIYDHHTYSDTLYYLIANQAPSKRIESLNSDTSGTEGNLYQIQILKEEKTNLLFSGRSWYSSPLGNGQAFNHTFSLTQGYQGIALLQTKVMAQSLQTNNFSISLNGQNRGNFSIAPIPNSIYGIKGREETVSSQLSLTNQTSINFTLNYQSGDPNGSAYLDYISLATPFSSQNLPNGLFHHLQSTFITVRKPQNSRLYRIQNLYQVQEINSNGVILPREKIAVFRPELVNFIENFIIADLSLRKENFNQSLIIITPNQLQSEAQRLANHKNNVGISSRVVTLQAIFDAFGYGTYDITAIRNFLAYHYHQTGQLKNVLFLGKGTYDYKTKIPGGRPNLLPSYSSRNSLNPLATYSSDDYFGFLEFGQGAWEESAAGDELLKIGVGRIPAINLNEAREAVNKIIAYETRKEMDGDWKRRIALFADDGDNNIHLNDAESHADYLSKNHPEYILEKIYLDRFEQVRAAGRQSSPQAREALKAAVEEGLLILNYIGHGNETTLTAEQVFQISDFRDWPENTLLPLLMTATCEFGRHDSPFIRSGAEEMLFAPNKGAIGLLTTGRPVFSSINFALNKAFIENVFEEEENGESLDLGEIFKRTKNNSLNGAFNRNFSMLGDPSLKLAQPELNSNITEVKDILLEVNIDTLAALQRVRIIGNIIDPASGAKILQSGNFNLELRDKKVEERTLGDESNPTSFLDEGNVIFTGEGIFTDGGFETELFIPININYEFGEGKLRIFAILDNGLEAMGAQNIIIGGTSENNIKDLDGPVIQMQFGYEYGEDKDHFSAYNIRMQALLADESGINISSNNLGQNILIQVNDQEPIVLNGLYRATENSFKKGIIQTPVTGLKEGVNLISLEAWDNVGNRSRVEREIVVSGSKSIKILHKTTYPNPSEDYSKFRIMHNRSGENLILQLRVFTSSGHEIYHATKRYLRADYLLDDFEWNFFHSKTNYPVKGTYIYELQLTSEFDNTSDKTSGKILIK